MFASRGLVKGFFDLVNDRDYRAIIVSIFNCYCSIIASCLGVCDIPLLQRLLGWAIARSDEDLAMALWAFVGIRLLCGGDWVVANVAI